MALNTGLMGDRYATSDTRAGDDVAAADEEAIKDQSRIAPSLDIIRVEPTGETVVAGRAEPGALVRLLRGAIVLGESEANSAGEWVIVPDTALGAGATEIGLVAVMPDGTEVVAEESIVIEITEGGTSQPLVVVTRGDRPSEIMQMPEAGAGGEAVADAQETQETTAEESLAAADRVAQEEAEATVSEAQEAAGTEVATSETAATAPSEVAEVQATSEAREAAESAPSETQVAESTVTETQAAEVRPSANAQEGATEAASSAEVSQPAEQQVAEASEASEQQVAEASEVSQPTPANEPAVVAETAPTGTEAAVAPESTASVQVQTVESDEQGRIFASGQAGPGSSVRIYLDNEAVGDAAADNEGRWTLVAEKALEPGDYDVRVDQLATDGTVVARAQVVFTQAVPVAAAEATQVAESRAPDGVALQQVEIRRGDNLWRISRRLYGQGIRYTVIYDANRNVISDPNLIFPGQVFVVPPEAN